VILLDTCVLSELARTSPEPRVLAWLSTVPEEALRVSVLTLGEIREGTDLLDPGARRDRLEHWLGELVSTFEDRIVPVDTRVALRWGAVSAAARKAGRARPPIDALIAATALHHGMRLATRNVRDFEGTGVDLVDPWSDRE
jgi:predicted nucleic acid-binding protein